VNDHGSVKTKAQATRLAQKSLGPNAFALYDPWSTHRAGKCIIAMKLGQKLGRGTKSWQRISRGRTYEEAIELAIIKLESYGKGQT
jgi:hypothetical protein